MNQYGALMDRQKKNAVLEETPVPVPLCPPQIPHELGWILQTTIITEMMPFHSHLFPYSTIHVTKSLSFSGFSQAIQVGPFPFSFLASLAYEVICHSHLEWTSFELGRVPPLT
jgi:hypothetical protein